MTTPPMMSWPHPYDVMTPMTSSKIFEIWLTGHMTFCCTLIGPFVPRDLNAALWLVCTVVSPITTHFLHFTELLWSNFQLHNFSPLFFFHFLCVIGIIAQTQVDNQTKLCVRGRIWVYLALKSAKITQVIINLPFCESNRLIILVICGWLSMKAISISTI